MKLGRPPRWGILMLALAVVLNAAVFSVASLRSAPADTYVPAARAAPAVPAAASETTAPGDASSAPLSVLAVYGDGYAAGNDMGGLGPAGWPAQLATQTGTTLSLHAVPRAGYVAAGVSGQNYLALVQASPAPDADVTVLFGSRNDAGQDPAAVQENAVQAISTIGRNAPGTAIVVVGPVWSGSPVPPGVLGIRDAVQAAASNAGVTFVDPLAEGWFDQPAGLIGEDGVSPTDEGHTYLADAIAPVVQSVLAAPEAPAHP
jgi:lysophospholipase L1-like esterase